MLRVEQLSSDNEYRYLLLFVLAAAAVLFGLVTFTYGQASRYQPTIGGDKVPPGLDCADNEVIGHDPLDATDRLSCVHVESFATQR